MQLRILTLLTANPLYASANFFDAATAASIAA